MIKVRTKFQQDQSFFIPILQITTNLDFSSRRYIQLAYFLQNSRNQKFKLLGKSTAMPTGANINYLPHFRKVSSTMNHAVIFNYKVL